MADGRDLVIGPGGLAGFTVHLDREPNPGTRRLMDWLGVEIDVTATAAGMAICLVGGCGWHWDGQGERHEAIEAHRAAEHDYIPAHRFSVRSHLNGAEGYDIDVGPADGRAALDAMDAGLPQRPAESKEDVETVKPQPFWTRETILEAIRAWAAEHGRPPVSLDWNQSSETHPAKSTVAKHFGSWGDAIVAAGFPRPTRGGSGSKGSSVREPKAREASGHSSPAPSSSSTAKSDDAVLGESPSPLVGSEAGSRTDEHGDQADGHHDWLLSLGLNHDMLADEIARLDELSVLCAQRRDALQRFLDELAAA